MEYLEHGRAGRLHPMIENWLARLAKLMRGSTFASAIVLLLVGVPIAFLSMLAVETVAPLAYMDSFVQDLLIKRTTPVQAQDPQIVVVVIDEATIDPDRLTINGTGQNEYHYRDPID